MSFFSDASKLDLFCFIEHGISVSLFSNVKNYTVIVEQELLKVINRRSTKISSGLITLMSELVTDSWSIC